MLLSIAPKNNPYSTTFPHLIPHDPQESDMTRHARSFEVAVIGGSLALFSVYGILHLMAPLLFAQTKNAKK